MFCERNGLGLRGHRDGGPVLTPDNSEKRDGIFRSLLRFAVRNGDSVLEEHLRSGPRNAGYYSKDVQNELIEMFGNVIMQQIVARIKNSGIFSVIVDETTDNSIAEQMSLCVRYVYDNTIYEDFIGFKRLHQGELRGEAMAQIILAWISELGLPLQNLIGLGFDGAASMAGIFKVFF